MRTTVTPTASSAGILAVSGGSAFEIKIYIDISLKDLTKPHYTHKPET